MNEQQKAEVLELAKALDYAGELFPAFDKGPSREQQVAQMRVQSEYAQAILEKDPKLNPISAMVIAGDQLSYERSMHWVKQGVDPLEAYVFVGSFHRLAFVVDMLEQGSIALDWVLDNLPDLWRNSDPDDTEPRYLELWHKAFQRNGDKTVIDRDPLPRGRNLTIYRGQDADATVGIAWSLHEDIARKFANGAGTRQHNRGGIIWMGRAPRGKILGYLTRRGESEVIISPANVMPVS